MEAIQTARHPQDANPPTFESVMAALQENAQGMKELREFQKETARIVKETSERQKENERLMKESRADFDARIGSLTNLFGNIAEYMVAPKMREKFLEFGLDFPKINQSTYVNDKVNKISLEIDVMLENGDKAMLVEVKTKLTTERINKHIERLEKMRMYANLHGDKRTFLGAVAGVVVTDELKNYALNQGFFVIEPVGQNLNITPPNGQPKEW
ncbi:MAG: hypothetical protein LBH97_03895 [Treponema sp.]|jgi:hypothetical protein|nr:hypothetical protein [Treponema sp.]